MELDIEQGTLHGDEGSLQVSKDDEITHKLAMLIEGECEGLGPKQAADKFGYSQQRYFQIREAFLQHGAAALANKKRGPKSNYRRTDEVERQVIRCRFLDPDANSEVIAQKLRQQGIGPFAAGQRSFPGETGGFGPASRPQLQQAADAATVQRQQVQSDEDVANLLRLGR